MVKTKFDALRQSCTHIKRPWPQNLKYSHWLPGHHLERCNYVSHLWISFSFFLLQVSLSQMSKVCFPLHHFISKPSSSSSSSSLSSSSSSFLLASSCAGSRQLRSTHYVIRFLFFGKLFPLLLLTILTLLSISQGFADPVRIPRTSTELLGPTRTPGPGALQSKSLQNVFEERPHSTWHKSTPIISRSEQGHLLF